MDLQTTFNSAFGQRGDRDNYRGGSGKYSSDRNGRSDGRDRGGSRKQNDYEYGRGNGENKYEGRNKGGSGGSGGYGGAYNKNWS